MKKCLLIYAFLLLICFMTISFAHNDLRQEKIRGSFNLFHQDLKNQIFDTLSLDEIKKVRASSPTIRASVVNYQKDLLKRLMTRALSGHEISEDLSIIALAKPNAQLDAEIFAVINEYWENNSFISLKMGSCLSLYLRTCLNVTKVDLSHFLTDPKIFEQIRKMYCHLFKEEMPNGVRASLACDMLFAVLPMRDVYISSQNLEDNIYWFLISLENQLSSHNPYRTLLSEIPFTETSHIVVSDAQILDPLIQNKLQVILAQNQSTQWY